jgi:hypothetical protein
MNMMKIIAIRSLAAAAALLALAACSGDSTGSAKAGPPARLDVVSGDLQTGSAGVELAQPLVVKVLDANGTPVQGQLVNFRVVSGGGSVFAGSSLTNAQGLAQDRWTLGNVLADTQRVEARAVDPSTGTPLVFGTFRALAGPGTGRQLEKAAGDAQTGPVGAALPVALAVRVRDQFGNLARGATVTWTGGGSFAPAQSQADSLGIARTTWTLPTAVGNATATATAGPATASFTAAATSGPQVPGRFRAATPSVQLTVGGDGAALSGTWTDVYGNVTPMTGQLTIVPTQELVVIASSGSLFGRTAGTTTVLVWPASAAPPVTPDTVNVTVTAGAGQVLSGGFPSPGFEAAWGVSVNDVWLVGAGIVARASGTTVTVPSRVTTYTLEAVWGSSASDVYAVGANGLILHYDGTQWALQPSGTRATLRAVFGASAGDVYAVGDSGKVLHNGGSGWQAISSPTTAALSALWVAPTGEAFAAGSSGVYRYAGGAWTTVTPSGATAASWLSGTSASDVVASTTAGVFTGGPAAWTRVPDLPFLDFGNRVPFGTAVAGTGGIYVMASYSCDGRHICQVVYRWNGSAWSSGKQVGQTDFTGTAFTGLWALQDGSVVYTKTNSGYGVVATPSSPLLLRAPSGAARLRSGTAPRP